MPFQDAGIEMTPANRKNKNKIQRSNASKRVLNNQKLENNSGEEIRKVD